MESKIKATMLTLLSSVINSLITTICALVYNNYLIRTYGSDVNGLISTLTQFVSMFSVLEGGFTTSAIVATYKPIINKEYDDLNNILYTAKWIFIKAGVVIALCVLVSGSIYITFIDSPLSYSQTYLLLFFSVLTTVLSLSILSKYNVFLQGINKEYVLVRFGLICNIISWILSMVMIYANVNIIAIYSINVLKIILNIIIIKRYESKHYSFVNYRGTYDKKLIPGTKDLFLQKIANTIFTSTDLVLISSCINLASSSVYNLYYSIYKSISTLIESMAQAPFNSFGQLASRTEKDETLKITFLIYRQIIYVISNTLFVATGILIIPFIKIYTKNISDFNYVYPSLAILLYSQIFMQMANRPFGTILNVTGNFKLQNMQCFCAAIMNILISIAFISQWGINSIIIGSVAGTLLILVCNIYQACNNVLQLSFSKNLFDFIYNYVLGVVLIVLGLNIEIVIESYLQWAIFAVLVLGVSLVSIVLVNYIINKRVTKESINYVITIILKRLNMERMLRK